MSARRDRSPARLGGELVVPAGADVGEGPLWDEAAERLLWVDIPAGLLHRSDPRSGEDAVQPTGAMLGAVALRRGGGLVAAVEDGFATLDGDGTATLRHGVSAAPDQRMNDAKCDPAGRYWGGSTAMTPALGAGALHCWDGDGARTLWDDLALPNGLGWSPDGAIFYLADSVTGVLWTAPFDLDTGSLGKRQELLRVAPAEGLPDGLCIDADGCIWLALWGGGGVRRHGPGGALLATVELPVSQPSSCALAPDGMLYVTSARAGLDAATLAREPAAGSVFAVDAGVAPVPVAPFAW
jgi:sugar lactone lactonase YvrE